MKIFVQLATNEGGKEVLELLRFPGPPVAPESAKFSGSWYGKGHSFRFRSKTRENLVAEIGKQELNEVRLVLREPKSEVLATLMLSPLSGLWSPPQEYHGKTAADEKMRMSFGSWEGQHRWTGCKRPSLLTCSFETTHLNSLPEQIESLGELLGHFAKCKILVGCADLDEPPVDNMCGSLGPWPGAFEHLGERFDQLHSILIGGVMPCSRMRSALGPEALFEEVRSGLQRLGIIGIPPSLLRKAKTNPEVLKCLVPRDESTAHKEYVPDPSKGEASLAPGSTLRLYTPARYRELLGADLLLSREGWIYVPILSARMIPLLGLEPESVFGWIVQAPVATETESLINEAFDELPESIPLKERILEAHGVGFQKWYPPGFGYEQVMEFVKRHYFRQN